VQPFRRRLGGRGASRSGHEKVLSARWWIALNRVG
jgi:hypothetical protein